MHFRIKGIGPYHYGPFYVVLNSTLWIGLKSKKGIRNRTSKESQ